MSSLKESTAEVLENALDSTSGFAIDVLSGMSREPKKIPSRWFYDEEGSRLFSRIMELPEYYLTTREIEILAKEAHAISGILEDATPATSSLRVVELGAGDGRKTELLLRPLIESEVDFEYRPIDVSGAALKEICSRMSARLEGLNCAPMLGDNLEALARLASQPGEYTTCALFLGSSIGNFERSEVPSFLMKLRESLRPGDFAFIGFDLVKDMETMTRAYSDSGGVTREFNFNLLRRMNRELGANFDLSAFRHEAVWNPASSCMESWIVSLKEQEVQVRALETTFHLRKWERIQTEVSTKFEFEELHQLAREAGFAPIALYTDAENEFANVLWQASAH